MNNALKELTDKAYERGRRDGNNVSMKLLETMKANTERRMKRQGRIRFAIVAVALCMVSFMAGRVYESHQSKQVAYNKDFVELALNLGVKK